MSRVRMPHNNRVSASAALRTNDMWSKTIGHDPYAAGDEKKPDDGAADQTASLMLLAKMSNLSGVESRGGCKKCGMLGHMTFQCRNAAAPVINNNNDDSSSSSSSSDEEDNIPVRTSAVASMTKSKASIEEANKKSDSDKKRSRSSRDDSSSDSDSDSSRGDRKKVSKKHRKSDRDHKEKKHKHKKSDREKEKKHKHHKKSKKSSHSSSP